MIDKSTIEKLLKFRDERDWEQFHNSKDLALALSIEASELLEVFLWKNNEDFNKDKLEEELADVFMYGLLLANKNNIDINSIILKKLQRNNEKYPVDKAKGKSNKYDEL
ncbi:nucleotide pyrophosphohydrolase [Elizabethkingia bruuniana]|uniref:nucleotide pyrophosphohydrolase n=1 Tax=Elizabethkingia bruuniana TaxID=1756149 RepID=UPI0007514520|nr:nucleotide pyrophosphohydrolase [Elizabethkingia bruuniana]AQX85707.1 nucleotide pyrophosphohydrolase [Elizabethkingia bruuniana]KUY22808.1 nucleotide pyrophosphohydrolase [Elizabethkingia bruuniana]OPB68745.1 nucleotide pyrophosphohydrolase [Elizabethkingia bruuniana]QDZ61934.1 nucleotide pyrophosphohydrolase [Elizabethkingia bruuniana]